MAAIAKRVEIQEITMAGKPRRVAETVPESIGFVEYQRSGAKIDKRARFVLEERGSELGVFLLHDRTYGRRRVEIMPEVVQSSMRECCT